MSNQMLPGETMFEYLKRKKKTMLENTLSRQSNIIDRKPLKELNLNESMDLDKTQRQVPKQNATRLIKSIVKLSESNSTTPKRVTFAQDERRLPSRSFIKMISPIRSKYSPKVEVEKSTKKESTHNKKQNYGQKYTRKKLNQKINQMRDVIEGFIRTGKYLKERSHFLLVDIKPFLKHIQNCQDSAIQKKTQELKAKLKSFQKLFKQFDYENSQKTIDSFYQFFSQHLNQLEGLTKAEIQQNKSYVTTEIESAKNKEISQLLDLKSKLQRELAGFSKRYDRLQQNYQQLRDSAENQIASITKDSQLKITNLQTEISQLQQELSLKKQQNQSLTDRLKELENQIKTMAFQKQKYQQDCLLTLTKVKSQQQQFLLNQIMVLKQQFNADITQMASLHKLKEDEYIIRLRQEYQQKQKITKNLQNLIQRNSKLQQIIAPLQAQSIRFKKQNQCLATDMHRINQQLYQHWLALKDIKTLSLRLDIFHKFKKIYEQLLFNQQLFL